MACSCVCLLCLYAIFTCSQSWPLCLQSRDMSSRLNVAYNVLTNKETRQKYDRLTKREGVSVKSFERQEGLTGPLQERAVPLGVWPSSRVQLITACNACAATVLWLRLLAFARLILGDPISTAQQSRRVLHMVHAAATQRRQLVAHSSALPSRMQELQFEGIAPDVAIDWLQQWGTSITFGCENPFPSPLQCDPVPEGVRFAAIDVHEGTVCCVGELYLEVDVNRLQEEQVASVMVTRVSKTPEYGMPGESAILKTLKNALGCGIFQPSGAVSLLGKGLLPHESVAGPHGGQANLHLVSNLLMAYCSKALHTSSTCPESMRTVLQCCAKPVTRERCLRRQTHAPSAGTSESRGQAWRPRGGLPRCSQAHWGSCHWCISATKTLATILIVFQRGAI